MKHYITLVLAVAIGLVANQVHANLLTNGDFTGGTSGSWQSGSAHGVDSSTNSVPTGWEGFSTGDGALRVVSPRVNFNGANQPIGSRIDQTVSGLEAGKWYGLTWTQAGQNSAMRVTAQAWNASSATGPVAMQRRISSIGGTGNLSTHTEGFLATGSTATVRFSDAGSGSTSSADVHLYDTSLELLNGSANIAPTLGTASAKDVHGSFGTDAQQAIDNSFDYGSGSTNYHSGTTADAWWMVEFDDQYEFTRIEIEARTGFNTRNGDFD